MRILAVFFAALFTIFSAPQAKAALEIDITQGNLEPMPIAVPDFIGGSPTEQSIGKDVVGVVRANLARSALFRPIEQTAYIQKITDINVPPRYADWKIIKAQALVTGRAIQDGPGRLKVEFRLWDVFGEEQMLGLEFTTTPENWRRIAHKVSDAIYERLTGEKGYFDTRVVFVHESGPKVARVKRLAIMDQDGANHRYLTDEGTLVLTPRFSPTAQEITYMSYKGGKPRVYLYNIDTGRQEVLGDFPGMTFAPRFSPDGGKVVMSMSQSGNTDLYEMDLRSRKSRKLTDAGGIDTAPCYSPDGRQIVFESDRGGTQQLYVMGAGGGEARRISFGDGRYANPVWSPRGDLIAFIKMSKGQFYLGVIRPDGSGERLITQAFHVEGPSWSPNGRVLTYFKESPGGGATKVYTIDITGYNERVMPTPRDASDPAWSPLNQ